MSDRMPERMSEYMSDRIAGRMSEHMPDRMLDSMSEWMQHRISTQYVGVGINRIKLFFSKYTPAIISWLSKHSYGSQLPI